jgi:hypothetical protein
VPLSAAGGARSATATRQGSLSALRLKVTHQTEGIGVTAFEGRALLWTLQTVRGLEMRGARCVGCRQGKRVIRHVGGVSVAEAKGDVAAFLVDNAGIALCGACLAFATEQSLANVERVLDELAPFAESAGTRASARCARA